MRNFFFRLWGGVRVIGKENVPKTGPLLVTPIHISYLDPPLMGCFFPRQLRFMAKKELFKGFLGWFLPSVGGFPVSRGDGDTAAIRQAVAMLEQGDALLMFPEGTRGDAIHLGPIQPGVAMLAKRSGATICPVGIEGTQRMLPKGAKSPKRARITMVIGQPLRYDDFEHLPDREARNALLETLRERLIEASGQAGLNLTVKSDAQI